MNTCGLTRLVVPAFLVGFMITALSGSEPLGWLAAAVTAVGLFVIGRVRGAGTACAVPAPDRARDGGDVPEDEGYITGR